MRPRLPSLLSRFAWVLPAVCLATLTALPAQSFDEVVKKINQSVRLDDKRGLDRLLKAQPLIVMQHFRGLCIDRLSERDVDQVKFEAIKASWGRVFDGSNAMEDTDRWMARLSPSTVNRLLTAERNFVKVWNNYLNSKDKGSVHELTIANLMSLTESFRSMGDKMKVAEVWHHISLVWKDKPGATPKDQMDAVSSAKQFMAERERASWTQDDLFQQWKSFAEQTEKSAKAKADAAAKRAAEGYGENVSAVDAVLMPKAPLLSQDLGAKVMRRPKKTDLSLMGGPQPVMWNKVDMWQTNGPLKLEWFKGSDIYIVRPGAAKFGIALTDAEKDPKKAKFDRVEAPNKLGGKASEFKVDAEGTNYAMWFYAGGQGEAFQGVTQNLQPTQNRALIYYRSAMEWSTKFEGQNIKIWDDNSNGRLFEKPDEATFKTRLLRDNPEDATKPEESIPTFDSIQVGKGPIQPLGGWIKVGDKWWRLGGDGKTKKVSFRECNPKYFKTGSLQLDFGGRSPKVDMVIVKCTTSPYTDAVFNIAGGKAVEVPAGDYQLLYGRVYQGRGARMATAWMFAGDSKPVTVEEGKTAKLALGAPFKLDFFREGAEDEPIVRSFSIKIRGRGGELYTYINGSTPSPEIVVAKDDSGKGARPVGAFKAAGSAAELTSFTSTSDHLGGEAGYFPRVEGVNPPTSVFKVRIQAGQKIGLREKKNALFGKLEAIWK